MLKFLRKYRKIILAGFIVILMVAFVAPQLVQQLGAKPTDIKVATLDGEPVRAGEVQRAAAEVRMLDSLSPLILPGILMLDTTNRSEHWLLLRREAERGGFGGDVQDGRGFIDDVAFQTGRLALQQQFGQFADQALQMPQYQERIKQMAEEMAARLAQEGAVVGLTPDDALRTLAAARGVMRMKEAYVTAARPSPALAISTARRYGDSATINYVLLRSSSLADEVEAPTADELRAHFDRFKDVEPGAGEFGIGYRQPQRIRLEWLVVDRASLAGAVAPDRVELRKMYDANRGMYTGEYEVERERVRADYMARQADMLSEEVGRVLRAEVLRVVRRLEQDGPYRVLPGDWESQRPKLDAVAEAIVAGVEKSKGVRIPLPRVEIRDASWLDRESVAALPGIGSAVVRFGNNQAPFSEYAFQVKELGGMAALGLQAGVTEINAPAADASGNLYFFTILSAREASAPESMDEVPTLADDLKSIRAFERLVSELPVYEQLARTDSLEAVGQLVAGVGGIAPLPMIGVTVSRDRVVGGDPEVDTASLRDAVMDAAERLDPRTPVEELVKMPETALSHALPASRSVVVARIKSLSPMTVEQYRSLAVGVTVRATMFEVQEIVDAHPDAVNPFGFEAMRDRLKFAEITRKSAEEAKDDAAASPSSPASGPAAEAPASGS